MNTKEYIASGILEAYVIGETTDQERKEVVCLSKIYPEVKEELTRLELTMEAYAQAHAMPANRNLKEKIFSTKTGLKSKIISIYKFLKQKYKF